METYYGRTSFLILFLLFRVSSEAAPSPLDNYRIIKLAEFTDNNSYLPIKAGLGFIIEIEGNPNFGYEWYLDNSEEVIHNHILNPYNLLENNSTQFYFSPKRSLFEVNGIYRFGFITNKEKKGGQKLKFVYRKNEANNRLVKEISKTIYIEVISPSFLRK